MAIGVYSARLVQCRRGGDPGWEEGPFRMVSCKHCSTQNSLDSTFCKRCGTSLSDEAIKEAQAKLDTLLEQGNAFFNEGRTEEAMAVAETAVLSNPSSATALSLKALCHERRGQIAEALECAERIVELNPDSELDKIKRNALRTRLQSDLRVVPTAPNRKLAFVAAISAVVLVGCLGIVMAKLTSKSADTVANRTPETGIVDPNLNIGLPTGGNPAANPQNGTPEAGSGSQGNPTPSATTSTTPNGDVPALNNSNPNRRRVQLPEEGELPGPDDTEIRPVIPTVNTTNPLPNQNGAGQGTTVSTPPRRGGEGNQIDPDPPVETNTRPPVTSPPVEDPGHIEINVRSGGGSIPRPAGNPEPSGANGLDTMLRVGTQQFQMGNYSGAAKLFEQALRSGGDAVVLNQRLGQAYSQLGRNGEAIQAYQNCIKAADSALSSGRGNKSRLATVKETAEQALKVLQGG